MAAGGNVIPMGIVRDLIEAAAAPRASAPALLGRDRPPMTYGRLLQCVDRLGLQLRAMGIGPGDRVAIVLPNGPEMAVAFLAVASCAVAAPLNPAYRQAEFAFYLSDLRAKALLTTDTLHSEASSAAHASGVAIVKIKFDPGGEAGAFELDSPPPSAISGVDRPSPGDVALILHTSGTTSRPKIVPLTHANLCASARHVRSSLELSSADSCLNIMPLFHIHGLVAALLASLAAGGSVVCTEGFVITEFFDWLRRYRPTWYTAVPTMHQAIIARAAVEGLPAEGVGLRFVRSSSSALPPQVAQAVERMLKAPMIEAYGMTEAAHQMCSNPLPPGERRFGSVGKPAGPQVAILNDTGEQLAAGQSGEVAIRGPNVMAGYENNPQANQSAFSNGWLRTGDLGRMDADGYLFLSGRIKEIINRGGEKISPREVDEALLDHGDVAAAMTFAMPDARLGEEIAAAVVLRHGSRATEQELIQFAATRLADFKIPRRIVILDEIPKGATGKPQRIGMAAKLGLDHPQPAAEKFADAGLPLSETQKAIAEIWREVLKRPESRAGDNFFDLGGDSVLAAQVIARVRRQMGKELPLSSFFSSPTLGALAAAIEQSPASAEAARISALLDDIEAVSDEEAARLLAAIEAKGERNQA